MSAVQSRAFWAGIAAGVLLGLVLRHPAVQGRPAPHFRMWGWTG